MNTLAFASIKELKSYLEKKEISREELLTYFLQRFEQYDSELGSALELFDAQSILDASSDKGILGGIPGILKDNIAQKGRRLTCASRMLENFKSVDDATASERLKKEGALLLGRANMDEFAMGSSNETSAYFKAKNPWNHGYVPGGSSGGSAAAVAAGLVPWALGSDTGGSVRQPAGFCGLVGLKPTYGLVSRNGLVAYGSSLDQIGVITRTVADNAAVLSVIAGNDLKDSSILPVEKKDYTRQLSSELPRGLKIGIVNNTINAAGMNHEVAGSLEQAIQQFETMGATITHISLPTLDYSAAAYFILSRAEAASNLARFDGVRYGMRDRNEKTLTQMYSNTRHDGFGSEVRSRIIMGNYVLSAGHAGEFYENAKKVQRLIRRDFIESFKKVDLLLMPTQPTSAFRFGAYEIDRLQMDLQDYFTCPMNLAGVPAISVPCGFTKENMPIGMQLIGPHLAEEFLYKVAYTYEQNTNWYSMHPAGY